MADGITLPLTGSGDGTAEAATDDTGATGHVQKVKLAISTAGSPTLIPADAAHGLDVDVTRVTGDVNVVMNGWNASLPTGTNAIGKLSANTGVDIGDVDITSVVPGVGVTNLGKAQGDAAGSVDVGAPALVVRRDVASPGASIADGDYGVLSITSDGSLRVTGGTSGTEYTEDVAAAADPIGRAYLARRRDTLTVSEVSADGDNIAVNSTSKGQLHVAAEILTMPAASKATDDIGAAPMTGVVMNGQTALTPKFDTGSVAASQTDSSIVAAVTSKKIRVTAALVQAGGTATDITFESDDATTDTQVIKLTNGANGGAVLPFNPAGWFETDAGEALIATTGAGSTTQISLQYLEV